MKRPISSDERSSPTLVKLLIILCLTLLLMGLWAAPVALAKTQFLKEADRWIYQSQQALIDSDGQAWDATLLKPMEEEKEGVFLWLTAQSDNIELDAAQPLGIEASSGQQLSAPNLTSQYFVGELPAPNVGQYDIAAVLSQLQRETSVTLRLPTKSEAAVTLSVPTEVLEEWLNVGTCEYLICDRSLANSSYKALIKIV